MGRLKVLSFLSLLLLLALSWFPRSCDSSSVHVITGSNFADVEEGEWMLEFYAPWCPACKQFASTWEQFAEWTEDQGNGLRVGKVDVTAESVLSGQFMVTQLPSLYHINEGEVRVYSGSRSLKELKSYVEEEKWRETEAIPYWRSPTAKHMQALGLTYWISQKGKEFQTWLEDEYNLPTYSVFIIIAVGTIVFGLILGGITVCIIELCIRMCSSNKDETSQQRLPRQQVKPDKSSSSPSTTESVGGASEETEETDKPSVEPPQTKDDEKMATTESSSPASGSKARKRKKDKKKQNKGSSS